MTLLLVVCYHLILVQLLLFQDHGNSIYLIFKMSLNRHMHPRNPYKEKPPDFKELATTFADFRSHCSLGSNGKILVNFQKDDAVRSLTKALLKRDFRLEIDIPKGCLVPRVPQRLNYILWIEDLLVMNKMNSDVLGVDVGTGASCIYALLGARQCGWRFVATDVDEVAAETAHANVWRNGLADYIRVAHVDRSTLLRDVIRQFPNAQFTFCMCNPPFFECDETERRFTPEASSGAMVNQCNDESSEIDRPPPRSATLARKNELQVEGGEVAFIGRMIDESVLLQSHVCIYTTMLGKKSSVLALRRRLERIVGVRYTSSTLSQGRTARWVLAWTFRPDIELEEVITTTLLLPCSEIQLSISPLEWIQFHLRELSIKVNREHDDSIICEARATTWTNQRARRRAEAKLIDPANKRARYCTSDIGVQVSLGEGDGRDSLSDSGSFESFDLVSMDLTKCTVSIQTYFPVVSQHRFVLRFRVRYCQADDALSFEFIEGSKSSVHQILQYFKNKLKSDKLFSQNFHNKT